jgi:hypothetical protein
MLKQPRLRALCPYIKGDTSYTATGIEVEIQPKIHFLEDKHLHEFVGSSYREQEKNKLRLTDSAHTLLYSILDKLRDIENGSGFRCRDLLDVHIAAKNIPCMEWERVFFLAKKYKCYNQLTTSMTIFSHLLTYENWCASAKRLIDNTNFDKEKYGYINRKLITAHTAHGNSSEFIKAQVSSVIAKSKTREIQSHSIKSGRFEALLEYEEFPDCTLHVFEEDGALIIQLCLPKFVKFLNTGFLADIKFHSETLGKTQHLVVYSNSGNLFLKKGGRRAPSEMGSFTLGESTYISEDSSFSEDFWHLRVSILKTKIPICIYEDSEFFLISLQLKLGIAEIVGTDDYSFYELAEPFQLVYECS